MHFGEFHQHIIEAVTDWVEAARL